MFWLCVDADDESDDDTCEDIDEDSAARRVCLLCGTILADGRFRDNASFRAEAMGKLTITILLQCLYNFIDRTPTIPTL